MPDMTPYDLRKCGCCGAPNEPVSCVCGAYPHWTMNEQGDVACPTHMPKLLHKRTFGMGNMHLPRPTQPNRWWKRVGRDVGA